MLPSSQDQLTFVCPFSVTSSSGSQTGQSMDKGNGVHTSHPHLSLACSQGIVRGFIQAEQAEWWEMVSGWTVLNVKLAPSMPGSSTVCAENTKHWNTECASAVCQRVGGETEWGNASKGEEYRWKHCCDIIMTRWGEDEKGLELKPLQLRGLDNF